MLTRSHFCLLAVLVSGGLFAQPRYPYVISTIAGDVPNGDGGAASQAFLNRPVSSLVDPSGNLYIAESQGTGIRKVAADGTISTVRGTVGLTGFRGMTLDKDGNILAVENNGTRIRMITPAGTVTTFGAATAGFAGDGGSPASAQFRDARDVTACTFRGDESFYVADSGNHRIRIMTAGGRLIQTAFGSTAGFAGDDGAATSARLNTPSAVACNASGESIYIVDLGNRRIRRVNNARIATIAGNGTNGNPVSGPALQSPLPGDIVALWVGPDESVYFAATGSRAVYRITLDGALRLVAGGRFGFGGDGGAASAALFELITHVTGDRSGNLYITDRDVDRVRRVDAGSGIINTIAGRNRYLGDGGPAAKAVFHWVDGLTLDAQGNVLVADERNHAVRKIAPNGIITTIAGTGVRGFSGDGGRATAAQINSPTDVKTGPDGAIYLIDRGNLRVRRIGADGIIRTIAGVGTSGAGGDGGLALQAQFTAPTNVAIDDQNNVYVADAGTDTVRRIGTDGRITKAAGTSQGFSGDGSLATGAQLCDPAGMVALRDGSLLVADRCNFRVRRVAPNGIISTWAGDGTGGLGATGAMAAQSASGGVSSLAVDSAGNVYATRSNIWVFMVDPAGVLYRLGGGRSLTSGDGGLALNAGFDAVTGVAVDSNGDFYVGDVGANRIRKLTLNSPSRVEATGGNLQTTGTNSEFPDATRVRVMGRGGLPVAGAPVAFAVTQGAATLSAASVNTGTDGVGGVGVTAGAATGEVVVTATVGNLSPVRFTLTVSATAVTTVRPPSVTEVVSAGLGASAVRSIAPLGLAAVRGVRFAAAGTSRQVQPSELSSGRYPRMLEGTCVEFAGVRAPLVSLTPETIVVQTPDVPAGETPVKVIVNCDQDAPLRSQDVMATVVAAAPEFFYANGGSHVLAVNQDGAPVGPAELGEGHVPAQAGDTITITGTGFGATDPPLTLGEPAAARAPTVLTPIVRLGERELTEAAIVSCSAATGQLGKYELVIRIPDEIAPGPQEISIRMGDAESPAGALLVIGQ